MRGTAASGFSWLRFPQFSAPAIQEAVDRAAERTHGRYTAADLRRAVARGELLAVQIGEEGVVFIAILDFPRKRVANLIAAGGKLPPDPRAAFEELCEFLRRGFEVEQVELIGRRGWGRALGLRPSGEQYLVEVDG